MLSNLNHQTAHSGSEPVSSSSPDTPAIIGGVVATVVVVGVVIVIMYIIRAKTHQTHGEVAVKKPEDHQ